MFNKFVQEGGEDQAARMSVLLVLLLALLWQFHGDGLNVGDSVGIVSAYGMPSRSCARGEEGEGEHVVSCDATRDDDDEEEEEEEEEEGQLFPGKRPRHHERHVLFVSVPAFRNADPLL